MEIVFSLESCSQVMGPCSSGSFYIAYASFVIMGLMVEMLLF